RVYPNGGAGPLRRKDHARPLAREEVADAGHLPGLRPSPTSHAVVSFRFQDRLTQGPAVRATDRRHSLRLDVLTITRRAYVQVRCAVFALWSEHDSGYAHQI